VSLIGDLSPKLLVYGLHSPCGQIYFRVNLIFKGGFMFWVCCRVVGIFLPFVVTAWYFKKHVRRDLKFEPLQYAFWSGLFVTALLLGMLCYPFLSTVIWQIRRVWWSCLGDMPGTGWVAIVGGILGVAYGRMNGGSLQSVRWLAAAPLLGWLFLAPQPSEIVEMNRFAPPRWKDDVCLQSTGFTCTPAAAATLLKVYGINTTESDMANRCSTSRSGTHVLGLARGLASMLPAGKYSVRACRLVPNDILRAQLPCITFTGCHAWVIFRVNPDYSLQIGEAFGGRSTVSWNEFSKSFCGEAVLVNKSDSTHAAIGSRGVDIASDTDPSTLTLAGTLTEELDKCGRTVKHFGSAPIEALMAQTESEGW
jgi:hypothetical protein